MDGYEQHLQVNHLAPALLSVLLLPSLIRGSPSRIVNVNSVMHYVGFVDTEDMNITSVKRKYTSLVGYSGSKLAEVMFSSVRHKQLPAESGISVLCVSPGIVHTNVARDLSKFVQAAYHLIPYFIFSPEEGSRSALFAATDSEEAHNVETAYKVWEKNLELIGLPSDAVERLIDGEEIKCRYGVSQEQFHDSSHSNLLILGPTAC